jgi:hypothetical protein
MPEPVSSLSKETHTEKVQADEDRPEELESALAEEQITQVKGRPVRLTLTLAGRVRATMVEPGPFPVSRTGFRSVMHGLRRDQIAREKSADQIYDRSERLLVDLVEENGPPAAKTIRRCRPLEVDPVGQPIAAIVKGTSPSRKELANELLTASFEKRTEIIEAGMRLYQQTVSYPEPDWDVLRAHRNWSPTSYMARRQQAAETLEMLKRAHSNGLFAGEEDLGMALEAALVNVRAAYVQAGWDCEPDYNWKSEGSHRRYLRAKHGVDALRVEAHGELARRLVKYGAA